MCSSADDAVLSSAQCYVDVCAFLPYYVAHNVRRGWQATKHTSSGKDTCTGAEVWLESLIMPNAVTKFSFYFSTFLSIPVVMLTATPSCF